MVQPWYSTAMHREETISQTRKYRVNKSNIYSRYLYYGNTGAVGILRPFQSVRKLESHKTNNKHLRNRLNMRVIKINCADKLFNIVKVKHGKF